MRCYLLLLPFALILSACAGNGEGAASKGSEAPLQASAATEEGHLHLQWRVQTQEDVYGFNVYRADLEGGPWQQVNLHVIPGHGTTALPREYEFIDSGLITGQQYYYYVSEVTMSGSENDVTPKMPATAKPRSYYIEKGVLAPLEQGKTP